jgi:hypothetical protein
MVAVELLAPTFWVVVLTRHFHLYGSESLVEAGGEELLESEVERVVELELSLGGEVVAVGVEP